MYLYPLWVTTATYWSPQGLLPPEEADPVEAGTRDQTGDNQTGETPSRLTARPADDDYLMSVLRLVPEIRLETIRQSDRRNSITPDSQTSRR
ncbi:hypothetical protein RRG08_067092 [Elysia crispata]|uniref:Uncharacterized protein n=1 Tax=Elysia crispata TaxID=231223 RepID=A0AAE1B895_9GAST|nr:hypothetical protein RRG08_067092 [Elysia crispata]